MMSCLTVLLKSVIFCLLFKGRTLLYGVNIDFEPGSPKVGDTNEEQKQKKYYPIEYSFVGNLEFFLCMRSNILYSCTYRD